MARKLSFGHEAHRRWLVLRPPQNAQEGKADPKTAAALRGFLVWATALD